MKVGKTNCMHDTGGKVIRVERDQSGGVRLRWYRCRHCHAEFTEPYPTVYIGVDPAKREV